MQAVPARSKYRYWHSAALFLILLCLALLLPSITRADVNTNTQALHVTEVLNSAQIHYPRIIESLAELRAAEARSLAAMGAFDIVFDAEGFDWTSGFYDGRSVEGRATRRLEDYGAEFYGGYRVSNGDFPIYEDKRFTNSGGQLELGALFSLIRGRDIDDERFLRRDTQLAIREADFDVLLTRIGIAQQTLIAYWRWVALGQKKNVYQDLLDIALERQVGLEQEVERGARPRIVLTENLQNIMRRKTLLATSLRDFNKAANDLSLFLRDDNGQTTVVEEARLPNYQPVANNIDSMPAMLQLDQAIQSRPEVKSLRNTITRTLRRIELNENDLLPQLDLKLELAQPFGGVAEGGVSRDETDLILGIEFSIPLERRAARGALAESKAKLSALRQKERLLQDQIQLEVRNILLNLRTSQELLELASQEVGQAEELRDAERKRFQLGASDFFLVNIREQTAAEALIRYFLAGMQREIAQTNYDAAMVNLQKLGIDNF